MAGSSEDYPPKFVREDIDGVKVVSDVVYESGLSKHVGKFIPVTGIRVLTLEDDVELKGCADCEFAGTLGQVRVHRKAEHGVSMGGARRGVTYKSVEDADAAGDVDRPLVLPADTASMTMRDFFTTAALIDDWGTVLEQLEQQVADLTEERNQLRVDLRAVTRDRDSMRRRMAKAMGLKIVTTDEEGE